MYSSPIVVFAGSSWLSVVPTATRIVPCARAGRGQAGRRGQHENERRMLLPLGSSFAGAPQSACAESGSTARAT